MPFTPLESIGPVIVGSTRPAWSIQIKKKDNNALVITGATFTGVLHEMTINQKIVTDPTKYSVTDGPNGIFAYAPVSADVAVPGVWIWQVTLTIGGQPYVYRIATIEILESLA